MDGKVIDYEKEVKESVQAEFNQFYGATVALDSISVYRKAYEIHSKNLLYEYGFCGAVDFPKEIYRALYEDRGNILKNLFEYLREDGENVYSSRDVEDSITGYCEERYFDLMNDVDYKHEVIESVDKEFKAYEADLLDGSKTVEEVYAHSYESMVKAEFRDTICGEVEFNDNVYKALYEERGKILEGLHQDFVGQPHASVNSFEETGFFIEDYCNRYYKDIMNEQDETPQMGMG